MAKLGSFDSWITIDIPPDMVAPKKPLSLTDFDTQLEQYEEWWWQEKGESAPTPFWERGGSTVPSHHQALGLSVNLWRPYFGSYDPKSVHLSEFRFASYEHTLTVGVGYDSMRCSRELAWSEAYSLLANACGAHIEVEDETGTVVWEGRVNKVGLTAAGFTIERGPLLDVANRCVVAYQLLDTSTNESQEQKRTEVADNADSQAVYGVQYRVLSAGNVTTAIANQIRDTHVALNAWPKVPKQLALGGAAAVSISLDCLGYYHWLNYPYRLADVTGTESVSDKIAAVIAADPNTLFTGTPNYIVTNTLQVQRLEDQDRSAAEIISDLVALGDVNYTRYLFGVWAGRAVRYEPVVNAVEYQQRADDKRQIIEDIAGGTVQPWAVLPGKWISFTTLFPGELKNVEESDRNMFIESVQYTSPYGLNLSGGTVNTLAQALAQWGIAGST